MYETNDLTLTINHEVAMAAVHAMSAGCAGMSAKEVGEAVAQAYIAARDALTENDKNQALAG
jgi:hypothetical protein